VLSYLEGWYAISEANRIFGFDGWSRETLETRCVLARENRGSFLAVYIARVRITVKAHGAAIIREGHGSGEGRGVSPGEVHDIALKAAETDATKRALATFGRPFGLELYRPTGRTNPLVRRPLPALPSLAASEPRPIGQTEQAGQAGQAGQPAQLSSSAPANASPPLGFHPDDTTPIPRPSRFYGRRQDMVTRDRAQARRSLPSGPSSIVEPSMAGASGKPLLPDAPRLVPESTTDSPAKIDKSALPIAEPKRLRDKAHLKFVASQPCLVCGRQPCDPHHLRFAQPRAIGLKVSDEFTVPLCRGHHRELHQTGNEVAWWETRKIKSLEIAKALWEQTHPRTQGAASISVTPTIDDAADSPINATKILR
jgi:hypothetical protein